jgi:hypothetical protein
LFNYHYKLKPEVTEGTKAQAPGYPGAITLVIMAATPEAAFELARARINMDDWTLDHNEDA